MPFDLADRDLHYSELVVVEYVEVGILLSARKRGEGWLSPVVAIVVVVGVCGRLTRGDRDLAVGLVWIADTAWLSIAGVGWTLT